ncbi:type III secretion system translocon subunit SctE [Arsenophonus sp. aPb]|uniref:type III secretion system translocon subunit SctE n=1 Tax=Arsenophonus sp. aPb TaxID=3041619 RepID=UPI0024692200|nr:type III secretion system translocon subunit SctE [Arsenophonus sp. aPb]WGL98967.1 type III secretion system translocon subunit SctE [Arsenophonus sp. aPb]
MGEIDTLNIRRNFSNNFNNENVNDDHFNEIASVIKNKMTISPEERTQLTNKAKLELILKSDSNNKEISNSFIDIPQIRKPNSSLSGKGNLLFLLAEMQKISVDLQGENLKLRIQVFNVKLKAKTENANQLSSEIDQLNREYQQQLACLDSMTIKLRELKSYKQSLENEVSAKKNELDSKQLEYKNIKENLTANIKENLTENSLLLEKKLAEEIKTLTNFIQQKESELIEINNLFEVKSNECETAINNVAQCADLLDDALNKLREFKANDIESNKPIEHHIEEALSNTAKLLEILTTLIITIGNSAVDKLKDDLEINRKRATANQNELKRKSEEYEQQVQKAEQTQKIAKCVGQILGGLVMAIGAVGALFGGAGIALMAVGIGLLAVDFIAEKATGRSLTDRIMSPLMEHVFMPLMEIIGKVVDAILEYTPLGSLLKEIDKAAGTDLLSIAKGIATAAVAVAAMIALAYVAKSSAKFLFEKMSQTFINSIMQVAKQAITQAIKKIIPNVVKNMSNQTSVVVKKIIDEIAKKLEQVASKISAMMEKATQHVNKSVFKDIKLRTPEEIHRLMRITANRLAMANQAIMFSNTATQGGLRINVANAELQKANINAAMLFDRYEIDRLMDDSQHLFTTYKHQQESVMKLFSDITEIITAQNDTGKYISKPLRA